MPANYLPSIYNRFLKSEIKNVFKSMTPLDVKEDNSSSNLINWRCINPNKELYQMTETTSIKNY